MRIKRRWTFRDYLSETILPEFSPRQLFERFNIEVLCTTDAATDTLEHHQAIQASGWLGTHPSDLSARMAGQSRCAQLEANIDKLSEVSGIEVTDYTSFIHALEQRREFFKSMGAIATDHAAITPHR